MCIVLTVRHPGQRWPYLMAALREEMKDRPARPPGRHWPDRPWVRAGYDALSGGTWLGVNDDGVTAALLNRPGTLGSLDGKRSRGELVLEALDHADARTAVDALLDLNPHAYRGFNLVVADDQTAFWLCSNEVRLTLEDLPEGVSMFSAWGRNDPRDPRIPNYLPLFNAAPLPDPATGDWRAWQALLAQEAFEAPGQGSGLSRPKGYGVRSASLIALSRFGPGPRAVFLHADGPSSATPYDPVA